MLVPRVYGLGDLSQILDERAYAQARAVLESLREDLAKVVITDSYRKAVKALDEHSFVLLVGEPAAGKTTIASMLAMVAADRWKASVLKLADPAKVVDRWNVNEPSQFFWVDDAFGVTQYESELVQAWNHCFAQVKAMLRQGAKIVMTSRDYIYNRARHDLKEGVFPLLNESQVVIDVHDLGSQERQQILYNHLKMGRQPSSFRAAIRPHLEFVAAHPRFIPETARRIADPLFTKDLFVGKYHLGEFVDKREQLLLEVIQGLDKSSKAALGLIYMRKDHLESPISLRGSEPEAIERLGSNLGDCITALQALNGSLVSNLLIDDERVWRFKHPTVGDAYAATLAFSPDLLGIFISGSSEENLMSQITCGSMGVEKAVIVPASLFPVIVARLCEFSASDRYKVEWLSSWGAKRALFTFLARRCSKEFLDMYLKEAPDVLKRVSEPGLSLSWAPEVDLAVRLHEFGLLPEEHRRKFVETVSDYAVSGDDVYALESEIRSVFTDAEFGTLIQKVRSDLLPHLSKVRLNAEANHRSTDSPSDHMQSTLETFETLKKHFSEDQDAVGRIDQEIARTNEWISETDPPEPRAEREAFGTVEIAEPQTVGRSIFDDIADDGS